MFVLIYGLREFPLSAVTNRFELRCKLKQLLLLFTICPCLQSVLVYFMPYPLTGKAVFSITTYDTDHVHMMPAYLKTAKNGTELEILLRSARSENKKNFDGTTLLKFSPQGGSILTTRKFI